ncbi:MAG: DUF11 domain-containing protein, partial [candidate division KSB1 bacterium]|nr:DUF11 domain-containing protein [candidate division KSB1 bacterium]
LADLSGATVSTYDGSPAVAAAPNGRVGVFWSRYLWNNATSQFNYNLYFAVLDGEGNVAVAPTNITNNDIWGRWSDLNVPRFYAPRIAAVGSNRFVMAWQRSEPVSGGWIEDIWYTVRNASGREIRGLTKLTDDLPQDMRHQEPALATLANDRVFLSWFRGAPGNDEILYVVLNSDGSIYRSVNVLSDNAVVDWRNFDAVQFSNGRILAAWEAWGCFPGEWAPRLRLAVLDESFNRVAGPTCLNNTALTNGDSQASLTADAQGRAVVTWMATDRRYQGSLYYALVDGDGAVITPPMIFRASQATSPYIETSFEGYGNTSYRWTPPAGVDAFIRAASPVSGTVGGYVAIPVTYGNVGGQVAGNVQLVATLPTGLTYDYDTSGVTPTVTGNQVRWSLPNLSVLARPEFVLYLRVAGDVPLGARLAVSLSLTTAGPETNPADNNANAEIVAGPAPGGPDGYGYIWDDAAPFRWVDATLGENTGITGDNRAGPVDIGFPFRFYDQTWTQVYVSTNGILVFGQDSHGCCGRVPMPLPGSPNNVIAPYWTDLAVGPPYNNGAIYVRRGGQAPKRYLAVAWHNVTPCCGTNSTDYKTFEVLLHENGDITFMYHTLQGWSGNPSVGIEDSTGYDGLQYTGTPAPGKAIRFFRPGPAARVRVTPPHQGQFARLGGSSTFTVPIQNTGELGSDTYDLTVTSTWPVTLYAADGVTPLADTDGDGKADTGPIAEGAGITVTVKVQTPPGAQVGSHNAAALTVGSSLDGSKQRTVTLQTAVPAPFVQGYHDASGGVVGLHLVRPEGNGARRMGNLDVGNFSAVAEIPGGGFVVIWNARRCPDSSCRLWVYEIFYSLVNVRGETIKAPTKLSDHTGVTVSTYDLAPAVAVLPNGTIGLVWYRYLYNPDTFQRNYNIYFAALDTAGHVVIPARNLTNNNTWGTWSDLNVPSFYYPCIAATEDNRFVLAWTRAHRESSGWVTDVWYLVLNANGGVVKPETRLTNDTPGDDDNFYAPALAALSGRQAFLAFERGGRYSDIYAVVLNSSGIVVAPRTNLSRDGEDRWDWGPDAVQMADGRVVVAWTSGVFPDAQIRFAV